MVSPFEQQLESAISKYEEIKRNCKYDDGSDMSDASRAELISLCITAVERASGQESVYYRRIEEVRNQARYRADHVRASEIAIGVARSLLSDIRNGYLRTAEELIHADVFSDFLEMAEHLLQSGYKDAAAVIAGSTLESHLRNLSVKFDVAVQIGGKPQKADNLNSDLVKAGAYSKLDQKSVTAWLGLRNNAAHGEYTAYHASQVTVMTSSVRDFVSRNPA